MERKTSNEIILQTNGLYKVYGSGENAVNALDGVDISVYAGELLVILGSSGSGKSTILNMLGGMDVPTGGEVLFQGTDIGKFSDKKLTAYRRHHVGFVFQSFNLIGELTVRENVKLTADLKSNPNIVDEMLDILGLSEKKDKYPSQLSGGQQQRVAIARALAGNADILLCDEPTGALDYETGKQILVQLQDLVRVHGKTVIIVTHTKEISTMADRVIVMKDGRVIRTEVNDTPASAEMIEW
ncbi:MAG: ABC transporter ATP-binding protein [Eubacterium sp.]|nr:ABC transporter ATP-binding protein [Eubacterium sp.]